MYNNENPQNNKIHSNDTSIIQNFMTNRTADEEIPHILSH